jgi:hypothetical protein
MSPRFYDFSLFPWIFPFILLVSIIGGIFYARWRKRHTIWLPTGIENSIIGIFGLIISFTFLQSGNGHRERSNFIRAEALAAETLYDFARELPDSVKQISKNYAVGFLENQLEFKDMVPTDVDQMVNQSYASMEGYRQGLRHFRQEGNPLISQTELDRLILLTDNLWSSYLAHVSSYDDRTPAEIMILLNLLALLVGFVIGFMNGITTTRHFLVPIIYFILFSSIMLVIHDLNNPMKGFIRPRYTDIRSAYERIKAS